MSPPPAVNTPPHRRRGRDDLQAAADAVRDAIVHDRVFSRPGDAAAAANIAEQRAMRVYGVISGQLPGPIVRSQAIRVHPPAMKELIAAWLDGFLLGRFMPGSAAAELETGRLAATVRWVDEHDMRIWDELNLERSAAEDAALAVGMKLEGRLAQAGGSVGDRATRASSLAGLWLDGLATALAVNAR